MSEYEPSITTMCRISQEMLEKAGVVSSHVSIEELGFQAEVSRLRFNAGAASIVEIMYSRDLSTMVERTSWCVFDRKGSLVHAYLTDLDGGESTTAVCLDLEIGCIEPVDSDEVEEVADCLLSADLDVHLELQDRKIAGARAALNNLLTRYTRSHGLTLKDMYDTPITAYDSEAGNTLRLIFYEFQEGEAYADLRVEGQGALHEYSLMLTDDNTSLTYTFSQDDKRRIFDRLINYDSDMVDEYIAYLERLLTQHAM